MVATGGADAEGNTLPLSEQDLRLLETIVDRISGVGQKTGPTPTVTTGDPRKHGPGG